MRIRVVEQPLNHPRTNPARSPASRSSSDRTLVISLVLSAETTLCLYYFDMLYD